MRKQENQVGPVHKNLSTERRTGTASNSINYVVCLFNLIYPISNVFLPGWLLARFVDSALLAGIFSQGTFQGGLKCGVFAGHNFLNAGIEVWTKGGLVPFYMLFLMELKTRRVHFAGCTSNPHEAWIKQIARELTNFENGFLVGKRYLLMDGDSKFCPGFKGLLESSGVTPVKLSPRSPNLNSDLERFFGSLKFECLSKMIVFGEQPLRRATVSFLEHYHGERNHQGPDNKIIEPAMEVGRCDKKIACRERLGGMLKYYHLQAAQELGLISPNDNWSRRAQVRKSGAVYVTKASHHCQTGRDSGSVATQKPNFQRTNGVVPVFLLHAINRRAEVKKLNRPAKSGY